MSADEEFQAFGESLIWGGWLIELLESSRSASFSSQAMTMKRGLSGTMVRVFLVWFQYTRWARCLRCSTTAALSLEDAEVQFCRIHP